MELLAAVIKFFGLLSFAAITVIGAVCQVFDGLSVWFTERANAIMKPKTKLGKAITALFYLLLATAAILLCVDMWKAMDKPEPVANEALNLASSIEKALKSGAPPHSLNSTFAPRLNDVIPRLNSSGNWSPELHAIYTTGHSPQNEGHWTNIVALLRSAAAATK